VRIEINVPHNEINMLRLEKFFVAIAVGMARMMISK
jgi:hypothetical protein